MGFNKALPFILQLFIFTLLVLLPFVQPSSSSGIYGTYNSGNRHIATSNIEVSRVVNEGGLVGTVEESQRLVPTGPDPLHHNNNPIRH
ncbi:hypothetical protein TanjilG_17233 [Lupinus angustifolius]|uniref:Uncharacterized protein n=1 Tax=Lupinus angustifolius TaxID=3871 RepID=A0A4P1R0Y1_LUPAN|nr:hypothetical protein TanjilG_17233 [Lupinus angustifolius]